MLNLNFKIFKTMTGTGYVNGSDLLLSLASEANGTFKAFGHCTSHTCTFNSETKDRAVKPAASVSALGAGLWKDKSVSGLSVQLKADGLRYYGETENSIKDLLGLWKTGATIYAKAFVRSNDTAPYLSGAFVISSIEQTSGAGEDVTYSLTLDNAGEITIDATKVDGVNG